MTMKSPDGNLLDWDPLPADREWWRSSQTGDRAYRIRRGGVDMVRLDRPNEELLFALPGDPDSPSRGQWTRDEYGSLFLPEQVARVAFMADRGMCALVGLHAESRQIWQEITDAARIKFVRNGPSGGHPARRAVYEAVIQAMRPYTR